MLLQIKMNQMNYQKILKIALSTKGLTKDLINKFSIIKWVKYFSSGIFQNHLLFITAKEFIKYFRGNNWIDAWIDAYVSHHLLLEMSSNGYCLIKNDNSILKK